MHVTEARSSMVPIIVDFSVAAANLATTLTIISYILENNESYMTSDFVAYSVEV
jgi:hypothetical protein